MAAKDQSTALNSHKRPRGERTVNDEEVEEFFTILKRLQRLRSWVLRSGTNRRTSGMTWRPEFTLDDFREVTDGQDRQSDDVDQGDAKLEEREAPVAVASRSFEFDLNVEPEPPDVVIIDG